MYPVEDNGSNESAVCLENAALCPRCDLLVRLPLLAVGTRAVCPRCKTTLSMCRKAPRKHAVSNAISALLMLLLAHMFPFVTLHVAGMSNSVTLMGIPALLVHEHYDGLAALFMVFVQLMPLSCLLAVLLLYQNAVLLSFRIWLAKWLFQLKAWCMAEIFLAGVLVSLVKLQNYGDIETGASFIPWCLFCLLQVRTFQCIDRRWLWNSLAPAPAVDSVLTVGETGLKQGLRVCSCCRAILPAVLHQCPRCHRYGYARRTHSVSQAMALLVTAVIFYIPANIMPVMVTQSLEESITSTVMAGIIFLWQEGSYPVALIIFIASIMIPSVKILALGWLCVGIQCRSDADARQLHVIYNVLEVIGRWSMIDIFVIAVLSGLVRMGQLMNVYPHDGVIPFAMVVLLTMFAAMVLDPRLIWDNRPAFTINRVTDQ